MYTTQQIRSYCKRDVIYAEAGVQVKIITFSTPVYICELDGKRFPCHMDKLSEVKPGEQVEVEPGKPQPKKRELLPDPSKIRRKLSPAEQMQLEYLNNERLKRSSGNK